MFVDVEYVFDVVYLKFLGVDVENLIVCQFDNGEMALESKINILDRFKEFFIYSFDVLWRNFLD